VKKQNTLMASAAMHWCSNLTVTTSAKIIQNWQSISGDGNMTASVSAASACSQQTCSTGESEKQQLTSGINATINQQCESNN